MARIRKTKRLTHVSNRHVSSSLIDQRNEMLALQILLTDSPSIETILPLILLHQGLPMQTKLLFYLVLSHMIAAQRTNNLMMAYHLSTMGRGRNVLQEQVRRTKRKKVKKKI